MMAVISVLTGNAQTIWKTGNEAQLQKVNPSDKIIKPSKLETYQIDVQVLSSKLANAIDRFDNGNSIKVDFPTGDGNFETFDVYTSGTMSKGLALQFPSIQSFFGKSADGGINKIYFTITPQGFRGVITGDQILYMDPFSQSTPDHIMIYNRQDLSRTDNNEFTCDVDDSHVRSSITGFESSIEAKAFQDLTFRTYDIAVAVTSEYSAYHDDGNNANGNARVDALAGVVTTMTRVNSVFEQEMSIRFSLVPNNNLLIYVNGNNGAGDNDPYDNYSGSQMLTANTGNINGVIGSGSYDIGHVFSTGGGGIASAFRCDINNKGRGVTGIVTPEFDPFDIDYVCHEIGHQFGAAHTYYNPCFGSPGPSPYETGSASTIMGYAGICTPNVQENSDAYFHLISLFEMHNALANDTCDAEISLTNNGNPTAPTSVNDGGRTIPRNTPFKLTATSNTPDAGEVYTYNWEQLDAANAANTGAVQPPLPNNTSGPLFRTKFHTTSPTRYFPNIEDLANGVTPTWEVLPNVSRNIRFFCTVRDNNPNGGQTQYGGLTLSVGNAGPLTVNSPSSSTVWYEGENKTITWNVNGTGNSTYATNVAIKLSLDGGLTYPTTLLATTANDGSATVTLPTGIITTQARIMVEAVGNYFFNISDSDFEIKEGTFELATASNSVTACQPSDATFSFNYNAAPGFTENASFTVVDLPAGLTVALSQMSSTTSTTINGTITGTDQLDAGQYSYRVIATTSSATIEEIFNLKIFDSNVGEVLITSPSNGAGNQVANPLLEWQDLASASSYLVEVSTNSDFSTIVESATVVNESNYQTTLLSPSQIYYWRITPSNDCNAGLIASIAAFQTAQDVCNTYTNEYFENNDNVWETDVNAVSARMDIPDDIEITQVSFYMNATHGNTGHIKMQFSAPTGRFAEIYNRDCTTRDNFDLTVSDSGTLPFQCGDNSGPSNTISGILRPSQAFSRFNGLSAQGEWVLLATDRTAGTGGTFNEFAMTVCGRLQYVNDVNNNRNDLLTTSYGATNVINQTLLRTQQSGTANTNMVYVITKLPKHGSIELSSNSLSLGDTFTQADLNNDRVQYNHNSIEVTFTDSFDFTVLGSGNTLMNAQTFNIQIEEPTLIYDFGWTPFAPNEETGTLNAEVINGLGIIATDAVINNFDIIGSANSLFLTSSLSINGDLTIEGYLDALQGELVFQGNALQVISGDGFINADQVTLSNTAGVTINSVLNVHGVLSPMNSILNTNGNVVFRSDASGTAQLDDASAATINGAVQVERYIPARRAFRLVASSVNSTGSIYENWQENGSPVAGLGTHITGSQLGANGFDTTPSGNSSMFTFDGVNTAWVSQPNTDVETLAVGTAYRLMVRGDRTTDLTINNAAASNTVLRAKGTLHTGDFNATAATSNGGFIMVANPYQANVDFKTVLNDAATNGVNSNFAYYWDPNLNARGGYATIDMSSLNGDPIPVTSNANKYLQPGQSIFLRTTGASTVAFKESHKRVSQNLNNIFNQPQTNSSVIIGLKNRATQTLMDQAVMRINAAHNPLVDQFDAIKFYNQDETLAIVNNSDLLSIDKNIMPLVGDRIVLHIDRFRLTQYTMEISIDGLAGLQPVLLDNYNGNRTILNTGLNNVDFDVVAGDAASNDVNRFEILFENSTLSNDSTFINDLSLYPNPVTSGQFTIESSLLNGKEVTVSLYNTLGQLVHSQQSVFNNTIVVKPQVKLSSGMYLARVSTQNESATLQVIVK